MLLELAELSRGEAEALLAAGLGGPMDGRSVTALWELTRGNALFLRELARHGVDRGLLAEDGGVWRWRGEVEAPARLAELVDLRIEDAGASERSVLELVAVGAPVELGLLDPGERAALEPLERAELVERRTAARRRFADVAHPLHGEAVRAQLTPTGLEAIHTRLAAAVEARGARRGGDLLRIAVWRLEAGATGDASLYARAADQALGAADVVLTERLARAAVQAGAGFGARLTLARALAGAGRATEAQTLFAELAADAGDDRELAAVALASARNLYGGLHRVEEADAVLRDAERRIGDDALRHELTAQRLRFTAGQGRPQEALAAALPVLDDDSVHERAKTTVAMGAVEALFSVGRTDEAVALAEAFLPVARRRRAELPHAEPVLLGMREVALWVAGRLVEATTLAESTYALLLTRRSAAGTAVEANFLGLMWLARGRVRTALRFGRESAALLRDGDGTGLLALALASVAQAAAQAGDADAAGEALAEMERTPLGHQGFAVELELARAWAAAAGGELTRARAHASEAAELARRRGQDGYAARALHELCRLGGAAGAAPELARLAGTVDGPFAATASAHAAALVARDGAALLEAAERFAAADALLVAAEAADAAAAAYRDAGRASSARAAAARAAQWLAKCEGARPPTLLAVPETAELTAREREIALLAARGASSREIADRLVLSVRTVDNHLQNAYRKLGVTTPPGSAGRAQPTRLTRCSIPPPSCSCSRSRRRRRSWPTPRAGCTRASSSRSSSSSCCWARSSGPTCSTSPRSTRSSTSSASSGSGSCSSSRATRSSSTASAARRCGWRCSGGCSRSPSRTRSPARLAAAGIVLSGLLVGSAMTTTALGTLIPVLRDAERLETRLGRFVLGAGAMGEFGPVLIVTVLLASDSDPLTQVLLLVAFVVLAVLAAALAAGAFGRGRHFIERNLETSGQVPVRLTVLLLFALVVIAADLGLDVILGAFAAGAILRLVLKDRDVERFESKLDAVGFGLLIPFFFVTSGMEIDLEALVSSASALIELPVFLGLFLLVRGAPALLLYRGELDPRSRLALAFYSATQLPLVVAITTIGVEAGHMRPSTAAALVGAGVLSVLIYPSVALALDRPSAAR